MKITRTNVEEYAIEKGLIPMQIDGIPEGFSFREQDIEIGGKKHIGRLIAFKPMRMWGDVDSYVRDESASKLVELYNKK